MILKRIVIIIVIGILLTILFTYPFILHLNIHYSTNNDFPLNAWIYWYSSQSILNGTFLDPSKFFNIPQLYPFPNVGSLLDFYALPSLILYTPINILTKSHIFSVNLTLFLTYVLNFISSYFCLTKLIKNTVKPSQIISVPSLIGAIIFTFAPGVINLNQGHTEYMNRFLVPPFFVLMFRYFSKPDFKSSFTLFLVYILNWFTNIEISIFITLFGIFSYVIFVIITVKSRLFNLEKLINTIKYVVLNCFIFVPLLLYFFAPYIIFSNRENFKRTLSEARYFSAQPLDFFIPRPTSLIFGNLSKIIEPLRKDDEMIFNYNEHTLLPGYIALIIISLTLSKIIMRKKLPTYKSYRKNLITILFACCLLFSVVMSIGPFINIYSTNINLPYFYLYKIFPLLSAIRTPTRIMYIGLFFTSYLVTFILSKFKPKIKGVSFTVPILILLILEYLNYYPLDSHLSKLINFNFNNQKVLFLPIRLNTTLDNSEYFIQQPLNNLVMVNGSTGSEDQIQGYTEFVKSLKDNTFNEKWFTILLTLKVKYIVIDKRALTTKPFLDKNTINELKQYDHLKVFTDSDWIVLDIDKIKDRLNPICTGDFGNIKSNFELYYYHETKVLSIHYSLINNLDCNMPFINNNRYQKIMYKISKDSKIKTTYLLLPPYLLSGESVEGNIELIKGVGDIYNNLDVKIGKSNELRGVKVIKE